MNVGNREVTVTDKGDKQRTVRFSYDTARALDRYMRERARHRLTPTEGSLQLRDVAESP